jgi:hypothetical protein
MSRQCHSEVDLARTGLTPSIMAIAAISKATVRPYDQSIPIMRVMPATAGPLMVAMVNISVFMEIAPDSNSLGTRLGTIAWPAGAQNARPMPNKAAMKNRTMTSLRSNSVKHSSATAAISSSP